jgi:hypothetical protein
MEDTAKPITFESNYTKSQNAIIMRGLEKDFRKRATASEMRDLFYEELAKMGYKTHSQIKEILRLEVKPILDHINLKHAQAANLQKTNVAGTLYTEEEEVI